MVDNQIGAKDNGCIHQVCQMNYALIIRMSEGNIILYVPSIIKPLMKKDVVAPKK